MVVCIFIRAGVRIHKDDIDAGKVTVHKQGITKQKVIDDVPAFANHANPFGPLMLSPLGNKYGFHRTPIVQ